MSLYDDTYRRSIEDPAGFWGDQAHLVDWIAPPGQVLDAERAPIYRWFPGATLNTCHNALDRHVAAGRGDQTALIYDSPVTGSQRHLTYAQLTDQVAVFAGALRALGVDKGDRVVIYMPMVPEAVIAMLACARLGAIHSVVFGGFAAAELAVRIDDAQPTVIVSASCGIEPSRVVEYKPLLDAALEQAVHRPTACVILQRPQLRAELVESRDIDWDAAVSLGRDLPAECAEVAATDPLYVLYTSGTTGKPKGIVRDNGGHAVAMAWSMSAVYDIQAGDVWWAASDVGWVVGHSYIVYAPLIAGATTVLYEGKPVGTPDAGAFWRVIAEHRVKALFTAPTAIRAIKKVDPAGSLTKDHDLSSLRTLFLAGERLDPDTYEWSARTLGVPVVDNWWQTETGWPIAANLRGLDPMPIKPGSPSAAVPGYDVRILGPDGREVPVGEEGSICIRLPLPPGSFPTLWRDEERYVASYLTAHDGYYLSGDGGHLDEDGYLYVMGRTDDVINVAGHRLSTGSIEAVVSAHQAVAECAVIGVVDDLKGQVAMGFVVLKAGAGSDTDAIKQEIVAKVRAEIGPVAAFRDVVVVDALPKTRSGKILRKTMRQIVDGDDVAMPSTIDDPGALDTVRVALARDPVR
ncbi:propionyl-CoA synthetase [Nocardioides immobilis]|uniref:Propionyl-CoA synthetase n=1 Tax=Nocardioides immobilis TaxID=2049295 RepID=A0A417Y0T3_9ACTN|nr:propionyl-CoA synthetase [Nocardioides immobilis]RHW26259.1 propionyl-CoA synthetase [Nocardioides immobilis]